METKWHHRAQLQVFKKLRKCKRTIIWKPKSNSGPHDNTPKDTDTEQSLATLDILKNTLQIKLYKRSIFKASAGVWK